MCLPFPQSPVLFKSGLWPVMHRVDSAKDNEFESLNNNDKKNHNEPRLV